MSGLAPSTPAPAVHSPAVLPRVALGRQPGTAAFAWAIAGVGATFVEAIYRLGGRALATVESGLTVRQWLAFGVNHVIDQCHGPERPQNQQRPGPFLDCAREPLAPVHPGCREEQSRLLDLQQQGIEGSEITHGDHEGEQPSIVFAAAVKACIV